MSRGITVAELVPILQAAFENGSTVKVPVSGNSMLPLLRDGRDEVIFSGDFDIHRLRRGELPLYLDNDGKYVMHRIISVNENTLNCCGDATRIVEKNIKKENVFALAVGFVRNGKTVSINSPLYRAYVLLWGLFRPFRPVFFRLIALLSRLTRRNKK